MYFRQGKYLFQFDGEGDMGWCFKYRKKRRRRGEKRGKDKKKNAIWNGFHHKYMPFNIKEQFSLIDSHTHTSIKFNDKSSQTSFIFKKQTCDSRCIIFSYQFFLLFVEIFLVRYNLFYFLSFSFRFIISPFSLVSMNGYMKC